MSAPQPRKSYVVEHMEPEMGAWSTLEYIAIASEVSVTGGTFYLSSLQPSLAEKLPATLQAVRDEGKFVATTKDVETISDVPKERVCLLDPQATQELSPEDGDAFDWFVFGGILGDDPPRDRTAELRKYGYAGRNLQKLQMTTDTAARVTRIVVEEKKKLGEIKYVDYPTLKVNKHESTEMPFRYVADENGNPVMPAGMVELIKKDADKSLDGLF
ncbi:SAM-dependent RNA methyltransferase [Sphaerosporella brunnea]|uniref:SAM-dependent RNA methyltransferase n=1 Tax=Sphaerosporella brunnea TaxID=1250544 RepID=A0A5J5EYC7_9PEZI|nr:SAM-dependent RNA methyltransferase [Sphaerosporella brunnea]